MLIGCGESRSPSDEVQKRISGLKGEFGAARCRLLRQNKKAKIKC